MGRWSQARRRGGAPGCLAPIPAVEGLTLDLLGAYPAATWTPGPAGPQVVLQFWAADPGGDVMYDEASAAWATGEYYSEELKHPGVLNWCKACVDQDGRRGDWRETPHAMG